MGSGASSKERKGLGLRVSLLSFVAQKGGFVLAGVTFSFEGPTV